MVTCCSRYYPFHVVMKVINLLLLLVDQLVDIVLRIITKLVIQNT